MYFIFIINNFEIGSQNIKAEEVLETLLKKKIWLYHSRTPNLKRISVEDKVLIYVAGPGRRFFTAKFTIASKIFKHNFDSLNQKEDFLFKRFEFASYIDNIVIFKEPTDITYIKEKLEFIKDKKNYGLFFRQANKIISERDYYVVLAAQLNYHN